jgi:peptidylprolyl isomerase
MVVGTSYLTLFFLATPAAGLVTFTRRGAAAVCTGAAAACVVRSPAAADTATLELTTADSGLKWAELRKGQGPPGRKGQRCTVDYMMTRRAGAKIYSTRQSGEPFSWTLGDGSVIEGLEIAVLGGGGVPPLLPGGARRVIVPQPLGYGRDRGFFSSGTPTEVLNLQPSAPAARHGGVRECGHAD